MRVVPHILATLALVGLAGCVETDASGKPIARDVTRVTKPSAIDAAMANATLDGSRIVASGKPGAISFLYPGTGRLAVRDLDTNLIPFSVELPAEAGNANRVLIAIDADGKLTGTTGGENGPVVTPLGNVNKAHTYVITYQAVAGAAAGEAR